MKYELLSPFFTDEQFKSQRTYTLKKTAKQQVSIRNYLETFNVSAILFLKKAQSLRMMNKDFSV